MDIEVTIVAAKSQLQHRYFNSRYSPTVDEWPPYQPRHYTTLALIHHKNRSTDTTVISVTRELAVVGKLEHKVKGLSSSSGSISQTPNIYSNTTKSISDIFVSLTASDGHAINPCVILIEGAPGIGKTVLAKEIAFQWANNKLLNDKKILLLLFLRECNFKNIKSVESLMEHVVKSSEITACLAKYLLHTEGKDLAIVFDGYDEISEGDRKGSIIADIIYRRTFAKCCLVITSRPTASADLHSMVDCRVEIVGFTEEDRLDYIQTALQGDNNKVEELTHYLQSNPTINALCYIPLNMTILLCLVEDGIDKLPKTQTNMYKQFINMTILRFIRKSNKKTTPITSIAKLPSPHDKVYEELAKLAYKALKIDKIIFTMAEIEDVCPNLTVNSSNWNGLGLLKAVRCFDSKESCDQVTFHFLHFSIQEYLAALYISNLSDNKQIKLLKKTFWLHRFYNTWIMYIGITCGSTFALKHFLSGNWFQLSTKIFKTSNIYSKYLKSKIRCLHLFQCLVESSNEDMIASVSQFFQGNQIDLSNQTLLPSDVNTLGFFLVRSINKQWEKLNLSGCNIGSIGINILCDRFLNNGSRHTITINKINFSHNHMGVSSLIQLLALFKSWHASDITITDDEILYDSNTNEIHVAIEDAFISYIGAIKATLQFNSFLFAHGIKIKSNMTISKNAYLLNCEWALSGAKYSIIESFKQQNFNNIHFINLTCPHYYISGVCIALLNNAAKNTNATNNEEISLFVYNPALSDQDADEIGSIIISNEIPNGVMLVISKSVVQGLINMVALSDKLLKMEILNLIANVRIMFLKDIQTYPWKQGLCVNDNISSLVIYTFIGLLHKISCGHHTGNLRIALIEESTLIAHDVNYKTIENIIQKHDPVREIYLSSCDIPSENYETLCYGATKIYIANCRVDGNFFLRMLSTTSVIKEMFIHTLCDIDPEAFLHSDIQRYSILFVTKDALVGCKPSTEQISLAFQLEPFINKLKLYGCQGNFEVFNQIVTVLATTANKWTEIDFTRCGISDIEFEIFYQYFITEKCFSTVETLKFSLEMLSILILPKLTRIILTWKVKHLYLCGINHDFLTFFKNISSTTTNNTSLRQTFLSPIDINIFHDNVAMIENFFISYICGIQVTVQLKSFLFGHGTKIDSNITISENTYLLNCEWELTDGRYSIFWSFRPQNLNNIHFINLTCPHYYISGVCIALLNNAAKNINATNDEKISLFVYNPALSDQDADEIGGIISNEIPNGVMLVISKSVVQGFINMVALSNKLLKVEILNLIANVRIMFLKDIQTYPWKQDFCVNDNISSSIIYTFVGLLHKIACGHHTGNLRIALIEESTLIAHDVNYKTIENIIQKHDPVREIYLSSCDIPSENYETLCYGATKVYIANCRVDGNFFLRMLSTTSVIKEMFIHTLCDIDPEAFLHSDIQRYSILFVTKDALVGCKPSTEQISLAFQLEPFINKLKLYGCQGNFEVFNQIVTVLATTANKWTEIDFTRCGISDIEFEIFYQYFITEKYFSTVEALKVSLEMLSISILPQLTRIILKWNVKDLYFCGINHDVFKCFIKNICTTDSASLRMIFLSITYHNKKTLLLCNFACKKFTIILRDATLYYIATDLSSKQVKHFIEQDHNFHIFADNTLYKSSMQSQELDISNYGLQGATVIVAQALQGICTLTKLNISKNNITDKAADDIAAAISCNTQLQELDISDNYLQATGAITILKELQGISMLKKLDIGRNNITNKAADDIATAISCNTQLEELDISDNCLQATGVITISKALQGIFMLKKLYISENNITDKAADDIAAAISYNTQLQELDISGNCLQGTGAITILKVLQGISMLKKLFIGRNNITDKAADDIATAVSCNTQLQELDVSDNRLQTTGAIMISKALQGISMLKKLYIGGNNITDKAADDIAAAISCNTQLKELNINGNDLEATGTSRIAKALQSIVTVTKLCISKNNITEKAADDISAAIYCNMQLQELDISDNDLQATGSIMILKALQNISVLKKLYIGKNNITDKAANDIAAIISCNTQLQELDISDNCLQATGAITISKALQRISMLKKLYISRNDITNKAANDIATAISCNTQLQELDVSDNCLQATGAIMISKALLDISMLKKLYISENNITDKAADDVAAIISCNTQLQEVDISGNNLTAIGAIKIAKALQNIFTLTKLYISKNSITDEAANSIAVAIQHNSQLQELEMSSNKFTRSGIAIIVTALYNNMDI